MYVGSIRFSHLNQDVDCGEELKKSVMLIKSCSNISLTVARHGGSEFE